MQFFGTGVTPLLLLYVSIVSLHILYPLCFLIKVFFFTPYCVPKFFNVIYSRCLIYCSFFFSNLSIEFLCIIFKNYPANICWYSRRLEDVLNTYLEDVFKTSRRRTKFLLVISVSNKSKCLSNKSLFHKLYLRNLRRIQNASLRTQ